MLKSIPRISTSYSSAFHEIKTFYETIKDEGKGNTGLEAAGGFASPLHPAKRPKIPPAPAPEGTTP